MMPVFDQHDSAGTARGPSRTSDARSPPSTTAVAGSKVEVAPEVVTEVLESVRASAHLGSPHGSRGAAGRSWFSTHQRCGHSPRKSFPTFLVAERGGKRQERPTDTAQTG